MTDKTLFYEAFKQADDGIFITDSDGLIRYANPAFEKITGFSLKEARGKTPRIIKSGYHSLKYYQSMWTKILSGKMHRSRVINRRKNGRIFYADHTVSPIKDKNGRVVYFIGIWKDITKQVKLEKVKDEFISAASHELKTPLTSLKAYSQLLKLQLEKKGDRRTFILSEKINDRLNHLMKLVKALLNTEKLQEGKLQLDKRTFGLLPLLKEVRMELNAAYPKRKINFPKSKISVYADRIRLSEVITNLLSNAVKYSPDNKKIDITAEVVKDEVVISIRDQGPGIPENERAKIFRRFYKIRNAKYDNNSGFGLGLYISAEIVKSHGGRIWVENNKEIGSKFCFTLPG